MNTAFSDLVTKRLEELHLTSKKYNAVHIRVGDSGLFERSIHQSTYHAILQKIHTSLPNHCKDHNKTIYITDSSLLEDTLQSLGCKVSNSKKAHLGHYKFSEDEFRDTLLDFFILANAESLYQISTYNWGSGFSKFASLLFNIPLETFLLN